MTTTISISEETKQKFDDQRNAILDLRQPRGELSADEYLNYLMDLKAHWDKLDTEE